jgi:hypothetical protein
MHKPMTDETTQSREVDEPNEFGFAGDPAVPEPQPERADSTREGWGESVAVPAGDLTEGITTAIQGSVEGDDETAGDRQ